MDYVRIWIFSLCLVLATQYTTHIPYYFIIVAIMLYGFFYAYFYPFRYPTVGKVLHFIG